MTDVPAEFLHHGMLFKQHGSDKDLWLAVGFEECFCVVKNFRGVWLCTIFNITSRIIFSNPHDAIDDAIAKYKSSHNNNSLIRKIKEAKVLLMLMHGCI